MAPPDSMVTMELIGGNMRNTDLPFEIAPTRACNECHVRPEFAWYAFPVWACLGTLFVVWAFTASPINEAVLSSFAAVVLIVAFLICGGLEMAYEWVIGWPQFLFKKADGWHVHDLNPLENFDGYAMSWGYEPWNTVIGNVIRVRNGGVVFKLLYQLFTWRSYNTVFKPFSQHAGNTMSLTFGSDLWAASVREGKDHFGTCPPTEFVAIRSLQDRFVGRYHTLEAGVELAKTMMAVIRYKLDQDRPANSRSAPRRWIYNLIGRLSMKPELHMGFTEAPDQLMVAMIAENDALEAPASTKIVG